MKHVSRLVCCALWVFSACAMAQDPIVQLEEPIDGAVHSGIGSIRGWAVSEGDVDRVEIWIDSEYMFDAPYGGERPDVGEAYPDIENSGMSGFSLAFGYSNLGAGEHTITAFAYKMDGTFTWSASTFEVVAFHKDFIHKTDVVDTSQATMITEGDEILLEDVVIGEMTYDLRLKWRTAEQGFEIVDIVHTSPNTVLVDQRLWLQVDLFSGLSWSDINAICPAADGVCTSGGVLNGHDMTGWTWATIDDLNELFNHYLGADVLGPGPDRVVLWDGSGAVQTFIDDGWRSSADSAWSSVPGYSVTQGWVSDHESYLPWATRCCMYPDSMATAPENTFGTGAWFYRDF